MATTLSAYCAYLVSSAPELLPEHSYDTRLLLDGVQTEAHGKLSKAACPCPGMAPATS